MRSVKYDLKVLDEESPSWSPQAISDSYVSVAISNWNQNSSLIMLKCIKTKQWPLQSSNSKLRNKQAKGDAS